MFAGFDLVRIINLPSRKDRRREMTAELRRIGLKDDPRVAFAEGVLVDNKAPFRAPGEKGVFLAHLNILREAAEANRSVLILEDDVDFAPRAETWHRREDADISYGGYIAADPSNLAGSDIIGAHCMGFSSRTVRALVPFLEQLLDHESPPPIDGAYVWFRRQNPDFTTVFADPVIAVQRPSRSDIAPLRSFDRLPLLRAPVGAARRFKRTIKRGQLKLGLREAIILLMIGTAVASLAVLRKRFSN